MELFDALESFLSSRFERGCNVHTVRGYRTQVGLFVSFLSSVDGVSCVEDITSAHVSFYLDQFRRRDKMRMVGKVSPVTIRKTAIALRTFFRWSGHRVVVVLPKAGRRLPKALAPDQVKLLLNSEMGMRERALIFLMLDSGLRLNEVSGLLLDDVDLVRGMVHVRHGKGDKERWAIVSALTCDVLRCWLMERGKLGTESFFVGLGGRRLTGIGIYKAIRRVVDPLGLRVHPHQFRHTFATQFLDAGGSLTDLQFLMGHESVSTTMVYLSVSLSRVRERFGAFSLVNRFSGAGAVGI